MTRILGWEMGREICDKLGLGRQVKAIDIHIGSDEVVTMTATIYPNSEQGDFLMRKLFEAHWKEVPDGTVPGT